MEVAIVIPIPGLNALWLGVFALVFVAIRFFWW